MITIIQKYQQLNSLNLKVLQRSGEMGTEAKSLGSASMKLGETETSLSVVRFIKTGKKEFQHFFLGMYAGKNLVFGSSF